MRHIAWTRTRRAVAVLAIVSGLLTTGCATVRPWQRGRLADPQMIFDSDAERAAYMAHWQESREGSMGGYGVQSGGCGCK